MQPNRQIILQIVFKSTYIQSYSLCVPYCSRSSGGGGVSGLLICTLLALLRRRFHIYLQISFLLFTDATAPPAIKNGTYNSFLGGLQCNGGSWYYYCCETPTSCLQGSLTATKLMWFTSCKILFCGTVLCCPFKLHDTALHNMLLFHE